MYMGVQIKDAQVFFFKGGVLIRVNTLVLFMRGMYCLFRGLSSLLGPGRHSWRRPTAFSELDGRYCHLPTNSGTRGDSLWRPCARCRFCEFAVQQTITVNEDICTYL